MSNLPSLLPKWKSPFCLTSISVCYISKWRSWLQDFKDWHKVWEKLKRAKKRAKRDQKKSQNYKFLTKKMRKWVLVCLTEVACGISNQRSCHDEFVDYEKTLLFYLGAKKSQNMSNLASQFFFFIYRKAHRYQIHATQNEVLESHYKIMTWRIQSLTYSIKNNEKKPKRPKMAKKKIWAKMPPKGPKLNK